MEKDLADFLAQAEEDTTAAADEMTTKVGSAATSMHGYFKGLLVGYPLDQVGGALLGGIELAVSDAAGNPARIAQLTDQINQQKAAIAQHEAELNKWVGTTAQVEASHYATATAIAAENDKVSELQQHLQPLLAAQQAAGKNATKYAAATERLSNDWQQHSAVSRTSRVARSHADNIAEKMTSWAEAHPKKEPTL